MQIDNSAFTAYQFCPLYYWEKYERPQTDMVCNGLRDGKPGNGIEPDQPAPDREFGTRFHQLLHRRHSLCIGGPALEFPDCSDIELESECQAVFARYEAAYPVEPLTFITAERIEVVPLPGNRHSLAVKIDGVVRHADGTIGPYDAKTERSGSTYNEPEAWAARSQATLYLWALAQLYPNEQVTRMVVDVITRGNSKRDPMFRRMDDITRTPERTRETLHNVIRVCDEIERHRAEKWWPRNETKCKDGWRKCDFFPLHVSPGNDSALKLYRPAARYLDV